MNLGNLWPYVQVILKSKHEPEIHGQRKHYHAPSAWVPSETKIWTFLPTDLRMWNVADQTFAVTCFRIENYSVFREVKVKQ